MHHEWAIAVTHAQEHSGVGYSLFLPIIWLYSWEYTSTNISKLPHQDINGISFCRPRMALKRVQLPRKAISWGISKKRNEKWGNEEMRNKEMDWKWSPKVLSHAIRADFLLVTIKATCITQKNFEFANARHRLFKHIQRFIFDSSSIDALVVSQQSVLYCLATYSAVSPPLLDEELSSKSIQAHHPVFHSRSRALHTILSLWYLAVTDGSSPSAEIGGLPDVAVDIQNVQSKILVQHVW